MYRKKQNYKPRDNGLRTTYGGGTKPTSEGSVQDLISVKALRDLPKSSYAIKADPYEAALPTSEPYPLIAKFNRAADASYSGDDNIDGGNVQQYANSTTSKFLSYFDSFRLKYRVNYRYLPIKTDKPNVGKGLVDEQRKSIAEAVSVLKATTFTQMAINNFAVETDLAMGSAKAKTLKYKVSDTDEGTDIQVYTNLTDVIYAMSIYYQIYLQDALSVMNWHNSFRLKQGTAIRDAWNREVANLNSFFGLMNKKAFLSLLESINLSFEGEYIDKDFMTQMNILSLMPSRRSNSITDPVLELQIGWQHPSYFKVYLLDGNGNLATNGKFFDDAELKLTIPVNGEAKETTYWTACDQLRNYLSLEDTKLWARSSYNKEGSTSITGTDNARYNQIKAYFDVITACMVIFKPLWADYREALDVMTRTGTLTWTKGFRPSITKDTDAALFYNLVVDDIYNMALSGPDSINYDEATKRWRTFSKWNMYTGIPLYDTKSGGSFLSFSFKNDLPDGSGDLEQVEYLPILFDYDSTQLNCVGVSRDGVECSITTAPVVMADQPVLARLVPLKSQEYIKMRVPTLDIPKDPTEAKALTSAHKSALYKTLSQIFGLCRIQYLKGTADLVYDYALDPDILAIYQEEVTDITNMAITYARANAPFRGTTSSADLLGFKSVKA